MAGSSPGTTAPAMSQGIQHGWRQPRAHSSGHALGSNMLARQPRDHSSAMARE